MNTDLLAELSMLPRDRQIARLRGEAQSLDPGSKDPRCHPSRSGLDTHKRYELLTNYTVTEQNLFRDDEDLLRRLGPPLGQLVSVTYPECVTAETGTRHCDDGGKDVIGPDLTVTQTYNHDYVRAVTTNLPGDLPLIDLEYADNLQVRNVLYANGTESFYQKDPWGMPRPRKITHKKRATKYFNRNIYRYDGAGNLWQAGTDFYTYDKAGRLLSAEFLSAGTTLSEAYEYDAADNLVSVSTDGGPPQEQHYWGNTNRLSGAANDIEYDAAGNVISIARLGPNEPRWELTYDAFDMQTSYVENPEGQFLNFLSVYGPGDYRIATLDSLTGERTVTLRGMGSSVLREWTVQGFGPAADWVHQKDYLYGPTGMWASRAQDGEVHYFHRDHLGSTRTITDSDGNKVGRRDYYPYGRDSRDGTGQYDQRMAKYTGHERDPHNLSDYLLGRTYAYPLRRFLTPDPARDGWNLYGYVGGNPMNAVDPTGLLTQLVVGDHTEGNVFGHTAIAINGTVYSFGTAYVDEAGDWGVSLEGYLAAQQGKRSTTLLTLDVSESQEKELLKTLRSNKPQRADYSIFKKSCVTVCEKALEATGILPNEPGPEVADPAGNSLQAGAPHSLLPRSLAEQVERTGLVTTKSSQGHQKVSRARAFWSTLAEAFGRGRR